MTISTEIGLCHGGAPHYCPNCDRSFTDIAAQERQRNVQRWYEQDQIIRETRQALERIASMDLRFAEAKDMQQIAAEALQRANVSAATRSDSVVAEGVTLPVGEKPAPWMIRRLEHLQAQYRGDANNYRLGSFKQSEALAFAVSLEHALKHIEK
jgi:hypothetical protein